MSRSTIKRIQDDTLESLTASVASLVAKDISQDKAINSTNAMSIPENIYIFPIYIWE